MTTTKSKSALLVEKALSQRQKIVEASLRKAFDSAPRSINLDVWAKEFDYVNQHITMPDKDINDAVEAYEELGRTLVTKLSWSSSQIQVQPQGSVATRTLIRTPDSSKFDIDAVCAVQIAGVAAGDPVAFFQQIGSALANYQPTAKNRCWRVEFNNKPFYIEFTPSVPLNLLPQQIREVYQASVDHRYSGTALAVVDMPTKRWKTSNPEGLATWVNDQTKRQLLRSPLLEKAAMTLDAAVMPVEPQVVPLSDTLRIAIRLFKRHRDMSVRRNHILKEFAPISIVIVTLLTRCYKGLADLGQQYTHPVELLVDLAKLMPQVQEADSNNGEYWVSNPTVHGENFAERWNTDNGKRKAAFDRWCDILISDLEKILDQDESNVGVSIREVFGCQGGTSTSPGSSTPGGGLAPQKPSKPYPAPATPGLA